MIQLYLNKEKILVDDGIYRLISKLNEKGFYTKSSCSGLFSDHYKNNNYVALHFFVAFDTSKIDINKIEYIKSLKNTEEFIIRDFSTYNNLVVSYLHNDTYRNMCLCDLFSMNEDNLKIHLEIDKYVQTQINNFTKKIDVY